MKRHEHFRWATCRTSRGWGVRCMDCGFLLSWNGSYKGAGKSKAALNAVGRAYLRYKRMAAKQGAAS